MHASVGNLLKSCKSHHCLLVDLGFAQQSKLVVSDATAQNYVASLVVDREYERISNATTEGHPKLIKTQKM